MKAFVGALALLGAISAVQAAGLLPSPAPFAEMLVARPMARNQSADRRTTAVLSRAFFQRGRGEGEGTDCAQCAQVLLARSTVYPHPSPSPTLKKRAGEGHRQPPSSTAAASPRFFFAGDGRLKLSHAHFAETLDVRYRRADGTYDPAALAQIRHFFRSREDGREAPISLRLIELLAYIQDHFHSRQMTLLSGYRSPEFNADLRAAGQKAAQASLHTEGLAADVAFAGVDLKRLWQQLRQLQAGGAGYYRSGHFLHIDTGRPRFWEETTSRVDENLAAGNARVFLRTDFDRYPSVNGAVLSLHSITVFPLRIAPEARVVTRSGTATVKLDPASGTVDRDGCLSVDGPADAYELRVVDAPAAATTAGRADIVLATCEPRIEQTPAEITSNPIELTAH